MKKRHTAIYAALLLSYACRLPAAPAAGGIGRVEYATADLARRTATVAWTWTDLADNAVRLSLTRNGEDFPTSGWGGTLFIGDGELGCAVPGAPSGYNELLFDVGREYVPTNGRYAVQVIATNAAGRVEEWARGTLTVRANPAASGMPTNWNAYADIARRAVPYIDAAISTNNPAFVAAVTNCPVAVAAAGGEIGGWATGGWGEYGTLGALLAAIAAAVSWLRASKADASDLSYALHQPQTAEVEIDIDGANHETVTGALLADRASNRVTLSWTRSGWTGWRSEGDVPDGGPFFDDGGGDSYGWYIEAGASSVYADGSALEDADSLSFSWQETAVRKFVASYAEDYGDGDGYVNAVEVEGADDEEELSDSWFYFEVAPDGEGGYTWMDYDTGMSFTLPYGVDGLSWGDRYAYDDMDGEYHYSGGYDFSASVQTPRSVTFSRSPVYAASIGAVVLPPPRAGGRLRDSLLRLTVAEPPEGVEPSLAFVPPEVSGSPEQTTFETKDGDFPDVEEGTWRWSLTETAPHVFAVAREALKAVAQGGGE